MDKMFAFMWFCWSYCDCDVGWSLARLPSLPFTLQSHGHLLWLVLIQQRKALQQFLLHRHLLGFMCHCNPDTKMNKHFVISV